MRIGFISTRLNGSDGVSLEVAKWSEVLQKMGHEIYYCAGELGGYAKEGTLIPKLHFQDQSIVQLSQRAFGKDREVDGYKLANEIYKAADEIRAPLRDFIRTNRLDLIIVQNALTIPMNLPLGVCLTGLIAEMGINTIAHHHDFFWERQKYQTNSILDLIDTTFPARLPSIRHVTINTIAQMRLKERRDIDSIVIPNVYDFSSPPQVDAGRGEKFRRSIGLTEDDFLFLQPTRIIQRKGIELSLELMYRLKLPNAYLVITHSDNDEGSEYWHWLKREARKMSVKLIRADHLLTVDKDEIKTNNRLSLWDAYLSADIVTYPSLYEGFGNALLEAIYYKKPIIINRYPVYNADIRPKKFKFIELEGYINDASVNKTIKVIRNDKYKKEIVDWNYEKAKKHFSYNILEKILMELLISFT